MNVKEGGHRLAGDGGDVFDRAAIDFLVRQVRAGETPAQNAGPCGGRTGRVTCAPLATT
ncbi:hypothetical protein [Burkholderia sp. Bp8963]|uniref:hypothetical protein n=1 Tax=Burkholderia sp. Bp8963 TaxID=2184547 RepID=UPI00163B532B|nr:hypothetical protein [Burkholderia sp. Bp8963]